MMRKSSISSCYDDSDNYYGDPGNSTEKRGSLPVVILDSWSDLTKERLEAEWERLSKIPSSHWDYSRLFIYHWIHRIFARK